MNHHMHTASIATSWHLMQLAHQRVAQQQQPDKQDQPIPEIPASDPRTPVPGPHPETPPHQPQRPNPQPVSPPMPEVGPRPVTPEIPTPNHPLPNGDIRA